MPRLLNALSLTFKYAAYPFDFLHLAMQAIGLLLAYPFAWVHDRLHKVHIKLYYKSLLLSKKPEE